MKKSIIVLALCFILMFAVAAVSAQEAETPVTEPVDAEVTEEPIEEAAEEPVLEVIEEPAEEPAGEAVEEPAAAPVCEKAADPASYKVTYFENNCLAEVPADCNSYEAGTEVTVKFEPVQYMDGKIFYGWDMNDDGIADFGYSYDKFTMPENDVELKAICVAPFWGRTSCPTCSRK